jgi:hypothetical protein
MPDPRSPHWFLIKKLPWLLGAWLLHILRHPHPRDELFPDAFPLAVSDPVRQRHSLVHAMVHGGQLFGDICGLLRAGFLLPEEAYDAGPRLSSGFL